MNQSLVSEDDDRKALLKALIRNHDFNPSNILSSAADHHANYRLQFVQQHPLPTTTLCHRSEG